MVKTLAKDTTRVKQNREVLAARSYEPEEFEADTPEERPVALLAQRRREFLAKLQAGEKEADTSARE